MITNLYRLIILCLLIGFSVIFLSGCDKNKGNDPDDTVDTKILPPYSLDEFVMGVDLSYLNQILDKGGRYTDQKDPYEIFSAMGANLVRLRLWNNPDWIREVYNNDQEILYSGYEDMKNAALRAKQAGMNICLDFHYSDTWADPEKQNTPEAWKELELNELKDSVYSYTRKTLANLKESGIVPAYVQIGNEINPGILHPAGHYQTNNWKDLGELLNIGIKAVRDEFVDQDAPKIILHIAQPENVRWFFNNLTILGEVNDFEVIGLSYYSKWSSVNLSELDGYIRTLKRDFSKEVMVMETAFPWINESVDEYTNIFGGQDSIMGYEVSPAGQAEFMKDLCQEVIDGGGNGVVYWEPGWISSEMKT